MSKLIKIMAGLAFVSVGLATPARPAHADATQDQEFYRLVVGDGWVVYNFPLMRAQGIAGCQREDAGETPYHAVKDLQDPNGPYTFDLAKTINSAAEVIYCPWHLSSPVDVPSPVSPPPVYPPPAWYPPPPPPPPPGYYPPPEAAAWYSPPAWYPPFLPPPPPPPPAY